MSCLGILEVAFGHHSSEREDSSLGAEMTYLGAVLALSASAVPWFPMQTQLRFSQMFPQRYRAGSQEAPRRWGIPAAVWAGPQRYPAVLQRQLAHAGDKTTAATCFWQLLWKLILLHNIALYLTQVPPEFIIRRFRYFESFPPDWFPSLCHHHLQ